MNITFLLIFLLFDFYYYPNIIYLIKSNPFIFITFQINIKKYFFSLKYFTIIHFRVSKFHFLTIMQKFYIIYYKIEHQIEFVNQYFKYFEIATFYVFNFTLHFLVVIFTRIIIHFVFILLLPLKFTP